MDAEVDGALHDAVRGSGTQRTNRQVQFVGDTVDHIAQQVETVNGKNLNAYGIEGVLRFLVVNGHWDASPMAMGQLRLWTEIVPSVSLKPITSSPGMG